MTKLSGANIETEIETTDTEYVKFSDYLPLVKKEILSNEFLSDKFREYVSIKLTIPVRELVDIDYFNQNNIDTTNLYQFRTLNIKHHDYSIGFGSSRGFLALYPDRELPEESQLYEMNRKLNEITDCDLSENKIQLVFLDAFIIAMYIRTWMWYGRGTAYTSCIYYDTSTRDLYATHTNGSVNSVIIEQSQIEMEEILKYVIGAFYRTINYKERYLLEEVLMIPIFGMHQALILNEQVFDGYKYNNMSEESNNEVNKAYQEIYDCIALHYDNNMDDLQQEADKIYSGELMEVCFDKFKVPGIKDIVQKIVDIYLDHDRSLDDCLGEIIKEILVEDNDMLIICILVNYPAYATHNFNYLYIRACDKGLDKVVRILISFSKNCGNMLDHNYNKDYGFSWVCIKGNLILAKYIYSLGNVDINNTFGGSAFNSACSSNHLELAKWLYTLEEVDIYMNKSNGFVLSCVRNYEEVYRWMWEIADDKERYFEDWKQSNLFIEKYDTYYNLLH